MFCGVVNAVAVTVVAAMRSQIGFFVLAPLMALIQFCDAAVGEMTHDVVKTAVPVFLRFLTAFAVYMLMKEVRAAEL